jgi:hypothetical protein
MANKGESLMSNEAWEELHTDPKLATLFQVSLTACRALQVM